MMETRTRKIPDLFDVSFKRRKSGRLLNIRVRASDVMDASMKAKKQLEESALIARIRHHDYLEYGISQAYVVEGEHVFYGAGGIRREWCEIAPDRRGGWVCHHSWRVTPYKRDQ